MCVHLRSTNTNKQHGYRHTTCTDTLTWMQHTQTHVHGYSTHRHINMACQKNSGHNTGREMSECLSSNYNYSDSYQMVDMSDDQIWKAWSSNIQKGSKMGTSSRIMLIVAHPMEVNQQAPSHCTMNTGKKQQEDEKDTSSMNRDPTLDKIKDKKHNS